MVNYKIVAVKIIGDLSTDNLIRKIFSRKDSRERTGVDVTVTESEWQSDGTGYGGDYVDYDRTYPQERIVLNHAYNQERMADLNTLARRDGLGTIRALLMVEFKPYAGNKGSFHGQEIEILIDDLTFENQLQARTAEVINGLISRLTPEDLIKLYQETVSASSYRYAQRHGPSYFCRKCHTMSPIGFERSMKRLVDLNPDFSIDLFYQSVLGTRQNTYGEKKYELTDYEKVIYDAIDDKAIGRAGLKSLIMLFAVLKDSDPKKAGTSQEIIRRKIHLRDTFGIFTGLKELGNAPKFIYETALRNDLGLLDSYSLEELVKIYHDIKQANVEDSLAKAVLDNLTKRMTVKAAVDILNTHIPEDGQNMSILHIDIMKLIFKLISLNSNSPEVKSLNMKKFVYLATSLTEQLMRSDNARGRYYHNYNYPVNGLALNMQKTKKAALALREIGAGSISRNFLRRLRVAVLEMPFRQQNIYLCALLEALKTRESIDIIFILLNKIQDLSWPLILLRNQNLTDNDLDRLKILFKEINKSLRGADTAYRFFILALIAQMIERLSPGSVTTKRSFIEWATGRRPWAKRIVRKAVADLELREEYIKGYDDMDKKLPFLVNLRGLRNLRREQAQVVVDNLPAIMAVIDSPYFDYFELLAGKEAMDIILETKSPHALPILEAAIEDSYNNAHEGYSYRENITRLINCIADTGNTDGIYVLERVKKLTRRTFGLFDYRRGEIMKAIKQAKAKLEAIPS